MVLALLMSAMAWPVVISGVPFLRAEMIKSCGFPSVTASHMSCAARIIVVVLASAMFQPDWAINARNCVSGVSGAGFGAGAAVGAGGMMVSSGVEMTGVAVGAEMIVVGRDSCIQTAAKPAMSAMSMAT